MTLNLIIPALILVAIVFGLLAISFYNKKRAPLCSTGNFETADDCPQCGAEELDGCAKDQK